jgi:hypothetical protein
MNPTTAIIATTSSVNVNSQTLEQCLKGSYQFAGTQYYNICNGTSYFIANGFWDITLGVILALFGISVILMVVKIIID